MSAFLPRRVGREQSVPEFEEGQSGRSSSRLNNTPRPSPVDSEQSSSRPSLPPDQQRVVQDRRSLSRSPTSEPPLSSTNPLPTLAVGEIQVSEGDVSPSISPSSPPSPSSSHKRARRTRKPSSTPKHTPEPKPKSKPKSNTKPNLSDTSFHNLHSLKKYSPQLVLENSGSVARDHLASERTFLAYVRTSLALAGMGVAIVQLFTIADLTSRGTGTPLSEASRRLQKFARPLGVTAVVLALVVLGIAVYRYFLVQYALPEQKFPVARLSVVFISFVLGVVVTVIFAALLDGKVSST
ncbi:hypothetical protein GALMADRAFT_138631 [Galerina marginata CBS 339.88]|uniref:DUF202 domain-containing protein n=1 Tax=Galerina marginata (strain CBS 339.88) TaxID=685588 RepID=A0A067T5D3_GALM3|nr:hypothetical protein GALMADRAFT_138631 [Galerina marginata CBS 339.88]